MVERILFWSCVLLTAKVASNLIDTALTDADEFIRGIAKIRSKVNITRYIMRLVIIFCLIGLSIWLVYG